LNEEANRAIRLFVQGVRPLLAVESREAIQSLLGSELAALYLLQDLKLGLLAIHVAFRADYIAVIFAVSFGLGGIAFGASKVHGVRSSSFA
jgi:hypothetical protein